LTLARDLRVWTIDRRSSPRSNSTHAIVPSVTSRRVPQTDIRVAIDRSVVVLLPPPEIFKNRGVEILLLGDINETGLVN
jgi:hypothetical protein